jgi:hypothetical protein
VLYLPLSLLRLLCFSGVLDVDVATRDLNIDFHVHTSSDWLSKANILLQCVEFRRD